MEPMDAEPSLNKIQAKMPHTSLKITTCEMHTGGEPLRIVESGYPEIKGNTLLEKRAFVKEHYDHLRKFLCFEPRGHHGMYGCLLVEPDHKDADLAVLFMHNEGYSTMCGHAVIALGRYAVDNGLVKNIQTRNLKYPEAEVNIQCPCGLVRAFVETKEGGVTGRVRFESVPAFVFQTDVEIQVPKFGKVLVDISYGGAFYAILKAARVQLNVKESLTSAFQHTAKAVREAVDQAVKLHHPYSDDLAFLYGVIFTDGKDEYSGDPTANVCVFANMEVDRSPCGSGVTARVALQYHKKQITFDQERIFQSGINDSIFTGIPVRPEKCGDFDAIIVEVTGSGFYTGSNTFIVEEGDHLAGGFLLR